MQLLLEQVHPRPTYRASPLRLAVVLEQAPEEELVPQLELQHELLPVQQVRVLAVQHLEQYHQRAQRPFVPFPVVPWS